MSQSSGEKELILGNKQLISLFFIVVALCGVFFAMGYMVRGNSIKGTLSTGGDNTAASSDAGVRRQQPEPPRETSDTAPAPADSTASPADAEHMETHPADDTPPPAPAPSGASVEPKSSPVQAVEVKPAPYADPKSLPKPEEPQAGATYIQVSALPLADAQAMVKTLREQHLPASVAPSSKENSYRILVGPYFQTSDVADAKAKLKTLGFSDTIVRKQ